MLWVLIKSASVIILVRVAPLRCFQLHIMFLCRLRSMADTQGSSRPSVSSASSSAAASSHFSFPLNNFWRDALISFKVCKRLYRCKIQVKFDFGNHLPNFRWVMALFGFSFYCSFPISNFWRDALISLKVCRSLYHCKIQVKFEFGNHPPNSGCYGLFRLSFWLLGLDVRFLSISAEGMHLFYQKFAEGYIIVKYRSSSILVTIRKILAE